VYQRLAYPSNALPTSLNEFFPNWTVGIGLSYPVFTGGRVRNEIVAAEAGVAEARQRLKLAEEGATLDAKVAALQLTEAEANWTASIGTAEQAQRAYTIAEVRFREGISTQLELSETRVQLQQALANRARAARDLQVARKRIELLPYLPLSSGGASAAASTNMGTSR
jgi:outer membrane protein TolC